jgi:hypothetical protein
VGGLPGRCRTLRKAPQNTKKSEQQTRKVPDEHRHARQVRPSRIGRVQKKSESRNETNRANPIPVASAKNGVTNLFFMAFLGVPFSQGILSRDPERKR